MKRNHYFYTTRIVYSKDAPFDLYMFAEDDRAVEIKKMLEKLDYFTLGGKQSIGMNLFRYISMDEVKTFNSKSLLLISKALVIPTEIDFDQSMYRINQLSSIFDNSVKIKRFRKPIIVFEEGSVFKDDKMTMGGLVKDEVANRVIYQNAIGMLI